MSRLPPTSADQPQGAAKVSEPATMQEYRIGCQRYDARQDRCTFDAAGEALYAGTNGRMLSDASSRFHSCGFIHGTSHKSYEYDTPGLMCRYLFSVSCLSMKSAKSERGILRRIASITNAWMAFPCSALTDSSRKPAWRLPANPQGHGASGNWLP